jgi:DNA polymerase-3 subunit epsilon
VTERVNGLQKLEELPKKWSEQWSALLGKPRQHLPGYVQKYLDAASPDDHLSWRAVPYSVLDIETTGLNSKRDQMLSVGLVDIEDGRIRLDRSWYTLLQPTEQVVIPAESIRIHGLLHHDIRQARSLEEVLPELLNRLAGRVLIVHYAPIDVKFLSRALNRLWNARLRGPAIDTILLAQTLYHQQRWTDGHDGMNPVTALRPLAEQAGIPIHQQHNALGDAITTAQLFLAQSTRLEQNGHGTLRNLLRAGRCLR